MINKEKIAEEVRENCYFMFSDYRALIDNFGFEIIVIEESFSEEGDSLIVFKDGDKYGFLCYGWGSCKGCDALKGCDSLDEVLEFAQELYDDIEWFDNLFDIKDWVKNRDWKGLFLDSELVKQFKKAVKKIKEVK